MAFSYDQQQLTFCGLPVLLGSVLFLLLSYFCMLSFCQEHYLNDGKDLVSVVSAKQTISTNKRQRSEVWMGFTKEKRENGEVWASCNSCTKTYRAESTRGTTNLRKHLKKCLEEREGNAKESFPVVETDADEFIQPQKVQEPPQKKQFAAHSRTSKPKSMPQQLELPPASQPFPSQRKESQRKEGIFQEQASIRSTQNKTITHTAIHHDEANENRHTPTNSPSSCLSAEFHGINGSVCKKEDQRASVLPLSLNQHAVGREIQNIVSLPTCSSVRDEDSGETRIEQDCPAHFQMLNDDERTVQAKPPALVTSPFDGTFRPVENGEMEQNLQQKQADTAELNQSPAIQVEKPLPSPFGDGSDTSTTSTAAATSTAPMVSDLRRYLSQSPQALISPGEIDKISDNEANKQGRMVPILPPSLVHQEVGRVLMSSVFHGQVITELQTQPDSNVSPLMYDATQTSEVEPTVQYMKANFCSPQSTFQPAEMSTERMGADLQQKLSDMAKPIESPTISNEDIDTVEPSDSIGVAGQSEVDIQVAESIIKASLASGVEILKFPAEVTKIRQACEFLTSPQLGGMMTMQRKGSIYCLKSELDNLIFKSQEGNMVIEKDSELKSRQGQCQCVATEKLKEIEEIQENRRSTRQELNQGKETLAILEGQMVEVKMAIANQENKLQTLDSRFTELATETHHLEFTTKNVVAERKGLSIQLHKAKMDQRYVEEQWRSIQSLFGE